MKSVSFQLSTTDSNNNIRSPKDELSPEEVQAIWYSPKELADILTDCHSIVQGEDINSDSVQVRGLELVASGKETYQLRQEVISDILEEQERLKKQKADADEKMTTLAEIERQHSQQRQRVAHLRALQDAQAALGTALPKIPSDRAQMRQRRRSERQLRNGLGSSTRSLEVAE